MYRLLIVNPGYITAWVENATFTIEIEKGSALEHPSVWTLTWLLDTYIGIY